MNTKSMFKVILTLASASALASSADALMTIAISGSKEGSMPPYSANCDAPPAPPAAAPPDAPPVSASPPPNPSSGDVIMASAGLIPAGTVIKWLQGKNHYGHFESKRELITYYHYYLQHSQKTTFFLESDRFLP